MTQILEIVWVPSWFHTCSIVFPRRAQYVECTQYMATRTTILNVGIVLNQCLEEIPKEEAPTKDHRLVLLCTMSKASVRFMAAIRAAASSPKGWRGLPAVPWSPRETDRVGCHRRTRSKSPPTSRRDEAGWRSSQGLGLRRANEKRLRSHPGQRRSLRARSRLPLVVPKCRERSPENWLF
jgi:hypothetical protein